jgi:VWFA-related protein
MRNSSEATRFVTSGGAKDSAFNLRLLSSFLLCTVCFFICPTSALAQDSSQQSPATTPAAQSEIKQNTTEVKQNSTELAAHDEPTTFKVNVRLVLVRAVVRDSQGHAVGNLQKEDFQVFDKGKPQVISQFEVEQPGTLIAKARQTADENTGDVSPGDTPSNAGHMPDVPERFIAYLFDDVHLEFGDLARVRQAAERQFSKLRPTDRAAIFTTSGRTILDYTDDRGQLHETLFRLQPQPITGGLNGDCLQISYYQADLIVNKNDPQATQVALQEEAACNPAPQGVPPPNPLPMVQAASSEVLSTGDHQGRISLGILKEVVHSLSRMPGQRTVVLISPGFITPQMEYEYTEIIDRAVRSQVIINTLDARGLYVVMPGGDASHYSPHPPPPAKAFIETAAASAQDDLLAVLADSTGGVFFHNNNDLDEGLRRAAETPEYSYVLAFVPQNLKLNGGFHSLKVTVKRPQKLSLQARRGYYALKNFANPMEQAKQEIEDATFSQEELHNLPVKLHTQFFKASEDDAKLIVLAHVDVRLLHFKKIEGRNDDVLTCVSALFNRNGNFIQGMEKTVTMHLKDDTLEHKLGSGITLKTSFDVKPGSYMVRLVVRDAEGQLMSAENGTVEIR